MMNFRFGIISDPHIALKQTIWDHPTRFHLVEISIPAIEIALSHLEQLNLDFLLLPGDLTQHGEIENHQWLKERLASLPFPAYVVPGNHDVPNLLLDNYRIGLQEFPHYYHQFGYSNPQQLYYHQELLPGVQLIGLNSNQFDDQGQQLGCLDDEQILWLETILSQIKDQLVLLMIHHNVIEHLPGQTEHELGKRYMLDNASQLKSILKKYGVKLIFTGHLHIQDLVYEEGIYEITTGSLVSYPHPYRVLEINQDQDHNWDLKIDSYRVESVPGWENLLDISREWMGDRSLPFMLKLLTGHPLYVPLTEAKKLAPDLRYFWADIAAGDMIFDYSHFPESIRKYFQKFGAVNLEGMPNLIDNQAILRF